MSIHYHDWLRCCAVLREDIASEGVFAWEQNGQLVATVFKRLRKERKKRCEEYELAHGHTQTKLDHDRWRFGIAYLNKIIANPDAFNVSAQEAIYKRLLEVRAQALPRRSVTNNEATQSSHKDMSDFEICVSVLKQVRKKPYLAIDEDLMLHLTRSLYNRHNERGNIPESSAMDARWYRYHLDGLLMAALSNPYQIPDPIIFKTLVSQAVKTLKPKLASEGKQAAPSQENKQENEKIITEVKDERTQGNTAPSKELESKPTGIMSRIKKWLQ